MASRLDDVVITGELARRLRDPDHELEAHALGALAEYLTRDPDNLLQAVADLSLAVCRANSAGVSILEPTHEPRQCRWLALAGAFSQQLDGTLPAETCPCGEVIRHNQVFLFDRPDRFFPALRGVTPNIHEALLVPFHLGKEPIGTLWVIAHRPERHFDAEDARVLQSLSRMAAAAWRVSSAHLSEPSDAFAALRVSEGKLRQSHDALEEQVRQRVIERSHAAQALEVELREREAAETRIKSLFARLVTAQEDERRRISREIHDQIGQQLTALRMNLEALRQHCQSDRVGTEHAERALRLAQTLDENIEFLTWDLRPMALDHFGLRSALETLVRNWSERFGVTAGYRDIGMDGDRLPGEVETHLYRIAQEALHNVFRHADATCVAVLLERRQNLLALTIEDDGCGFDQEGSASDRAGLGLLGMQERAALIGGKVEIESSPGNGTTVYVRVPVSVGG